MLPVPRHRGLTTMRKFFICSLKEGAPNHSLHPGLKMHDARREGGWRHGSAGVVTLVTDKICSSINPRLL